MAKILVVEDSPEFGEMLATVLQAEGHSVLTAQNGLHAISKLEFWNPDLIITDIHMPALNGLEMIRRIRLEGSYRNVPIIGLSAYRHRGVELAIKAGASVSLAKPVEIRILIEHVTHLLSLESAGADGSEAQTESSTEIESSSRIESSSQAEFGNAPNSKSSNRTVRIRPM